MTKHNSKDRLANLPSQHYDHPYRYEDDDTRIPVSGRIFGAFLFLLVISGYALPVLLFTMELISTYRWHLFALVTLISAVLFWRKYIKA